MANPYYTRNAVFNSGSTARGSEVKAEYDLVAVGFDAVYTKIQALEDAIGALGAGSDPGWGSAIDFRWFVEDTSVSSAVYSGVVANAEGNNLIDGYTIDFLVNNNNTGAATLNVGTLDGNVAIVKVNGPLYEALYANDMSTLSSARLTFLGGNWVLRDKSAGAQVGMIFPFGGSVIPPGYIECYGHEISRATFSALFTTIGTTYGAGDGALTFNVPDLRGRPFVGLDTMGGSAANVLLPLKYGDLVGADPTPPAYGRWLIKT